MKQITAIILGGFITMQCAADDAEIDEYLLVGTGIFITELNIPDNIPHSPVWTEPLFPPSGVITTNMFKFEKYYGNSTALKPSEFQIFSNDVSVAFGTLFEYPSFELTRNAFIINLIRGNATPELHAQSYEIQPNGVGDFRITGKQGYYTHKRQMHFIRGGKAISLSLPHDDNDNIEADLQQIAEVLDALLKNPPASQ